MAAPHAGLLRVTGTIDLDQFWRKGISDGDTVHIKVDPDNSFSFHSKSGQVIETKAFKGAWVKTRDTKKTKHIPVPVITKKNEITIRLQGIDTPELHYPTMLQPKTGKPKDKVKDESRRVKNKQNGEFRQMYGARAADELCKHLKSFVPQGVTKVPCYFETHVDTPTQVCDSHGRFVGDILVGLSTGGGSINKWLVEKGWAYPLFYDSMHVSEIEVLRKAWEDKGRKAPGRTPYADWSAALVDFVEKRNRTKKPYNIPKYPKGDQGPTNYPKIFRRQIKAWMCTAGNLTGARFYDVLANGTANEQDYVMTYEAFKRLRPGQKPKWEQLLDYVSKSGRTNFQPTNLVFQEKYSSLKKGPWKVKNSAKVTSWT